MLRVLRMFPFSQAAIKLQLHGGALRRGVGGDRRLRLFSLPPRRLRRGETPACGKDQLWLERPAGRSRPFGATMCKWWIEQLGGASEDAQSYWQGRCPKPQQGHCPCTLQGALPLDPFLAFRLERACLIVRTCCLCPKSALHMTRCPGRHHVPPSPSNPVSDPHTRGLSPPKLSHCPTISAGTSQF